MSNRNNMIPIPGRLHSVAVGEPVSGADEIFDDSLNKDQATINQQVNEAIGTGGSVDERIETAKSEVIGDAASDYNTLGKLEDKIQAEASARESAVSIEAQARQDAITAETNRATTRENQIYDLVHTPEQHYVTVATYADLANIASPSDDTVYRVSSYNGKTSQVDNTVYSEYGYDGTNFVFLCVKSQIDEVYDISAHHSNNTYVDLAAALDGGNNIPQELRRGGMSVKFVQSSDNKYVQARCMAQNFTTDVIQWQGIDDEPTEYSSNLVKSEGIISWFDKQSVGKSKILNYEMLFTLNKNIANVTFDKTNNVTINTTKYAVRLNYRRVSIGDILKVYANSAKSSQSPNVVRAIMFAQAPIVAGVSGSIIYENTLFDEKPIDGDTIYITSDGFVAFYTYNDNDNITSFTVSKIITDEKLSTDIMIEETGDELRFPITLSKGIDCVESSPTFGEEVNISTSSYGVTDYIDLTGVQYLKLSAHYTTSLISSEKTVTVGTVFYNENKEALELSENIPITERVWGSINTNYKQGLEDCIIKCPEEARYVRITTYNSDSAGYAKTIALYKYAMDSVVKDNKDFISKDTKLSTLKFVGKGSLFSSNYYYGILQKEHTYKVTLQSTSWNHPELTGTSYLFDLCYYKKGSTTRYSLMPVDVYGQNTPQPVYLFTINDNTDTINYLRFGGRADIGVEVYAVIEDVTDKISKDYARWPRVFGKGDADFKGQFNGNGNLYDEAGRYSLIYKINDLVRLTSYISSNYTIRPAIYDTFADACSNSNSIEIATAKSNAEVSYKQFRYGYSKTKRPYLGVNIKRKDNAALTSSDIATIENDLFLDIRPLESSDKLCFVDRYVRKDVSKLSKDDFNYIAVASDGFLNDSPTRVKFLQEMAGNNLLSVNITALLTQIPTLEYAAQVYDTEYDALSNASGHSLETVILGWTAENKSNAKFSTSGVLNIYFHKIGNAAFTYDEIKYIQNNIVIEVKNENIQSGQSEDNSDELTLGSFTLADNIVKSASITCVPYLGVKYMFTLPSNIKASILRGSNHNNLIASGWVTDGNSITVDSVNMLQQVQFTSVNGSSITISDIVDYIENGDIKVKYSRIDAPIKERNYENEKSVKAALLRMDFTNSSELKEKQGLNSMAVFAHTSDLHGDIKRFENFMDYAELLNVDAAIDTGDSVVYYAANGSLYLKDVIDKHPTIPFVHCIGNHECSPINTYNNSSLFDKHISPYVEQGGYLSEAATPATLPYYYVDLDSCKIRIVTVNQFDDGCYGSEGLGGRLGQAQVTWLCNTMLSTPEDYGVIIIMHANEDRIITPEAMANWNQTVNWDGRSEDEYGYCANGLYVNAIRPIKLIVDAFISKTSISTSYDENNLNGNNGETVTIDADFSSVANGVEFICYLTGHRHKDNIGYVASTTNKQLILNVVCGNCHYPRVPDLSFSEGCDIPRGDKGSTQDAFNIFAVDRKAGRVKLARVGSNVNFEGIERKFLIAPYKD